ncbi:unnamed protein product [Penicillium egyptiacum]|uniref:Uncharacterized protein n=1 Tax=Penicillium egyptiacum TaxID=1303716 RepID=A0A9W4KDJ6_9EURO|nr:unnamed protein product [Penicillium egyptiacum]
MNLSAFSMQLPRKQQSLSLAPTFVMGSWADMRRLFGGSRMTEDIDVIVDSDPSEARNKLLQANARFTMTPSSKLVFSGGDNKPIAVELLRGGEGRQLKLPDANAVSLRSITANVLPGRVEETPIPIIAPSVLVLTKLKRWAFIANSTRPASTRKAVRDVKDIQVILNPDLAG